MKRIAYIYIFLVLLFSSELLAQNKLQNLGSGVNTKYSETQPIISPDGSELYFTRSKSSSRDDQNRNIRFSKVSKTGYTYSSKELKGELNNEGWNAVCGFTADGKTMLLAGRYMPDGTLKGGFSISEKNDDLWTIPAPIMMKDLDLDAETQTATISADGNIIIFASNSAFNKEFYGLFDLYISFKQASGEWSSPKSLGSKVNSGAYETAPFLAADMKTLYFSSDGHNSFGGNDIFVSRRLDSTWTNWSEPQNLGREVNTTGWESYISVTASGKYAFVGSTSKSHGKMDIFKVQLKEDLKPYDDGLLADYYPNMKAAVVISPKKEEIEKIDSVETESIIAEKKEEIERVEENLIDKTTEELISEKEKTVIKVENTEIEENEIVEIVEDEIFEEEIIETEDNEKIIDIDETEIIEDDILLEKEISTNEIIDELSEEEETNEVSSSEIIETKKYSSNVVAMKLTASGASRKLENLGTNINSVYSEMAPLISPDGKTLYFSRSLANDWKNTNRNILSANLNGVGEWESAENAKALNNKGWNIVCGITPDGNMILLTGKYELDGSLGGGFSRAYLTKYGWSFPRPLNIEKFPEQEDTQSGTLSPDGKTIIFSSYYNIDGEFYGTMDLYITTEKADGNWTIPRNMGPYINSKYYETSPFLAADGKTLYFSTNGHGGYGSQDIYVTKRLDNTWKNWSTPVNIGEEVNSEAWESYFTVSAAGDFAYVGSRKSTYGKMDIFRIDLRNTIKPEPTIIVSGEVLSAENNEAIAATIKYISLTDTSIYGTAKTNPITGKYKIALSAGHIYGFFAEAENFYGEHENIDLTKLETYQEQTISLFLTPFDEGQVMELNNIFFDMGRSRLKRASFPELDKLAKILIDDPLISIEVGGHTEIGHSDKQLSLDRASSVKQYLIKKHKIKESRIKAIGYADTRPRTKVKYANKKGKNRRVEVMIFRNN